jgi:hypothetical protein
MGSLEVSDIMIVTMTKSLSDDQIISSVGRYHGFISYSESLGLSGRKTADQLLAPPDEMRSCRVLTQWTH